MREESPESEPVGPKQTCPCDDPSEQFQLYSDGHGYCYAGGCPSPHWAPGRLAKAGWEVDPEQLVSGSFSDRSNVKRLTTVDNAEELQAAIDSSQHRSLDRWGISQATCRHWDYRTRINHKGEGEHLMVYRDESARVIGIKVRNVGTSGDEKNFHWIGKAPKHALYGIHLLPAKGKMLVIAMGEKDDLTVSQLWANKFPVLGPSQGEANLTKDIAANLERLNHFEKIVLVPHADPAGFKAMEEAARMFPPGKAHIAKLPFNDANDMHVAGRDQDLINLIHNAQPFTPDGIVDADDIDDQLLNPTQWGLSLPYPFLTEWTYGLQPGQVWVIGAGTGVGKSDLAGEIVTHLIKPKEDGGEYVPTAVFNYEAGPVRTLKMIVGKLWSKRFNKLPPKDKDGNPDFQGHVYWQPADLEAAREYRRERCAKLFINDHRGAVNWASVKARLRYLKHAANIRVGVVDPVAAMVATEEDERKALDLLFAEAKQLAEELDIAIIFVSHLARPREGKSHEEGGRVTLAQFRGSGAIVMWASYVIVLERNQQGDEDERADTTLRMLKDRESGDSTGMTRSVVYNTITGRLEEAEPSLDGQVEPPPLRT